MNIQTVKFDNLSFVNISELKDTEIEYLKKNFEFQAHDLEDYLNTQQVAKIEKYKDYLLIVLDFPFVESSENEEENKKNENSDEKGTSLKEVFVKPIPFPDISFSFLQKKKKTIKTGHVNFYLGRDYLVVIHDYKSPLIDYIFKECQKTLKKRKEFMSYGSSYLFYRILDILVDSSFKVMTEIVSAIEKIDIESLADHPPTEIVEDISLTRRNIVIFNSMVKPSIKIFSEIKEGKFENLSDSSLTPWSSIQNHLEKIRYRLDGSRELIEGISRSHESILAARTNQVIKVLTMFTAIMLPLTFITGLYGMNIVNLPLAQDPFVLEIIILIMGILSLIMVIGFKIKKWL